LTYFFIFIHSSYSISTDELWATVIAFTASAQRLPAAEVQKWKWLAEAVGRIHQLLFVLLQVTSGALFIGSLHVFVSYFTNYQCRDCGSFVMIWKKTVKKSSKRVNHAL
jgi:hypothetical protein